MFSSQTGGTDAAYAARLEKTWITDWEFFATLTDVQLKRLQFVGQVWIPVRALSPPQRAALDGMFEGWRKNMTPYYCGDPDELVTLIRLGAETNLSNVSVGFAGAGGDLSIGYHVTLRDGRHGPPFVRIIGIVRNLGEWQGEVKSFQW